MNTCQSLMLESFHTRVHLFFSCADIIGYVVYAFGLNVGTVTGGE